MKFLTSPIAYLIYGALALYLIIGLFTGNWNPFASAEPQADIQQRTACSREGGSYGFDINQNKWVCRK